MLYLSQLILNPRSPQARGDLSDCRAMHQRILSAFPDAPDVSAARERYGALFRVEALEGGARILAQSRERPDWSRLPQSYLRRPAALKRIDDRYDALVVGQELVFRLRANPTKRISQNDTAQEVRWRGKRVELRTEEEQLGWLRRKGEQAGFTLVVARAWPDGPNGVPMGGMETPDVRTQGGARKVTGRHAGRWLSFGAVIFEGRLQVIDPARLRVALEMGIGSGKAFGFGLLSLAAPGSLAL